MMKEEKRNSLARRVGANIAAYRKLKGWTQAQLGEILGIGTDSLCRIERGTMAPRFQRLEDIAKALGCSVSDLFRTPEEILDSYELRSEYTDKKLPLDIPTTIAKLSEQILFLSKQIK
ncbi:MAG: helix-turn-helix transcriptional regulator [Mailhella sp.]|nr:helix-turn-helix transcriptional regulator [Mailhella sp.]